MSCTEQYYLWEGDYISAIDEARNVLSKIKSRDLRGYRSLWNYLAGSACWLESKNNNPDLADMARKYYSEAKKSVIGLRWLVDLARQTNLVAENIQDTDEIAEIIEKLESNIINFGYMNNYKYNKHQTAILDGIDSHSDAFEESQRLLGELIGFNSGNSRKSEQGAPDPWWILRNDLCIVFEDYSDAKETSKLSVEKARQAFCHDNWIKSNAVISSDAEIVKVLVTSVKKAHRGSLVHLDGVFLWELSNYKKWVKNTLSIIRELRSSFPGEGNLEWRSKAIAIYQENDLSPTLLSKKIKSTKASDVLVEE